MLEPRRRHMTIGCNVNRPCYLGIAVLTRKLNFRYHVFAPFKTIKSLIIKKIIAKPYSDSENNQELYLAPSRFSFEPVSLVIGMQYLEPNANDLVHWREQSTYSSLQVMV